MQTTYLELIQLTELYLLQKLPPSKQWNRSENGNANVHGVVVPPAPKISLKVPPAKPIVPTLPPKVAQVEPIHEPVHNNCDEILSLIKTHCPKIKLIENPPKEKTIFLLLAPKSPAETQVATNLAVALNKEGFEIVQDLNKASLFIAERECLLQHPQKGAIKRDTSGKLAFGKCAVLVIGSLVELVTYPEKRRELWTEILNLKL